MLTFIREIIYKFANLKDLVLQKLLEIFPSIKSIKIMRGTLWILGEFCETAEDIQSLITIIRQLLGDLPIVDDEIKRAAGIESTSEEADEQIVKSNASTHVQTLVTADGTYATQSAFVMPANGTNSKKDDPENRPTLRG